MSTSLKDEASDYAQASAQGLFQHTTNADDVSDDSQAIVPGFLKQMIDAEDESHYAQAHAQFLKLEAQEVGAVFVQGLL
jgi:hypothetical protein